MKIFWAIISLISALGAGGCDDITKPPRDPSAKSEARPQAEQTPLEIAQPALSKADLIETYNLTIEIRNGIKNWQAQLDPLQKARDPYFSANRSRFRKWMGEQAVILSIRVQKISPEKNQLPNDHPGVSLDLAIRSLKKMMGDYTEYYYLQRPLNPEYEKELKKWLDDFQTRMQTYPFPENPGPATPKLNAVP